MVDHKNSVKDITKNLQSQPEEVFYKQSDFGLDFGLDLEHELEISTPQKVDEKIDERAEHYKSLQEIIGNTAFLSEKEQISRFNRFNAMIQKTIEKTIDTVKDSARSIRDKILAKYTRFTQTSSTAKERSNGYDFGR